MPLTSHFANHLSQPIPQSDDSQLPQRILIEPFRNEGAEISESELEPMGSGDKKCMCGSDKKPAFDLHRAMALWRMPSPVRPEILLSHTSTQIKHDVYMADDGSSK